MFGLWRQMWLQPVENINIDLQTEKIDFSLTHLLSSILENNRVIVNFSITNYNYRLLKIFNYNYSKIE